MKTIPLTNEQAKRWGKLKQKKYRTRERLFLIEGLRLVQAAIDASQPLEGIVVTESFYEDDKSIRVFKTSTCPFFVATEKQWKQLSETVHGQGILAIAAMPEEDSDAESWSNRILVLDRVQDPGNLGTILRTAEAFGFRDVFLAKGCADCYDGKTLRASMGGVFTLRLHPWAFDSLVDLKEKGYQCMASALRNSEHLPVAKISPKVALIIGNEANGVREDWLNEADLRVIIPMTGEAESLNAGIAAGILMYEIQEKQSIELSSRP